jgi:hypothetical protein
MIAEAFFKRHAAGISKFGDAYKDKTVEDNVDSLVKDPQ